MLFNVLSTSFVDKLGRCLKHIVFFKIRLKFEQNIKHDICLIDPFGALSLIPDVQWFRESFCVMQLQHQGWRRGPVLPDKTASDQEPVRPGKRDPCQLEPVEYFVIVAGSQQVMLVEDQPGMLCR
jgi:hypothetical protein